MNAFQIRNYNPFYGNGIHVLLRRENDIYIYIERAVSSNMHTNNIVFISIMLHFKCIDYFTGMLKHVDTFLTYVAAVNDVN